jgi:hypothetical protein
MRRTITIVAFLLFASQAMAAYGLGDSIEDFTLLTPDGDPVSLSDFEGDVILINFFATW